MNSFFFTTEEFCYVIRASGRATRSTGSTPGASTSIQATRATISSTTTYMPVRLPLSKNVNIFQVMAKIKVVCRHGVEYSLLARGTQGEVRRLKEMLSNCCCYVCHNRGCETPIEGKQECRNECELYGKRFCEKKE